MWNKIIKETLLWLVVSLIFGLLQLWVPIFRCGINGGNSCFNTYFWNSGVVLFFCSGIAISNAFEIWREKKIKMADEWNILLHIIMPICLLLAIVIIYSSIIDDPALTYRIKKLQSCILIFSMIYSACSKIQLRLVKLR